MLRLRASGCHLLAAPIPGFSSWWPQCLPTSLSAFLRAGKNILYTHRGGNQLLGLKAVLADAGLARALPKQADGTFGPVELQDV